MHDRIEINPHRCHGKPVVRGTRTPVTVVLGAVAGGDTFEQIATDYDISVDDIRACIEFAREGAPRDGKTDRRQDSCGANPAGHGR